ncbi:MAG: hypothetical protein N3C62_06210 [Synergistetes bacterium]|nr:hypothetical protein [Synergistota bacterium]MCX8128306.1 hypothetical protein [Synergistota bacterium]MDW8192625.1 hypothetical protein [Synergistota bacterium]
MFREEKPLIIILDFDGIYGEQYYLSSLGRVIDLRKVDGVKFMCFPSKLCEIDDLIPKRQKLICFLGGGEYHHFSLLFLRRISFPFVLLLFDKHFDALKREDNFIRCDSWIRDALGLKNLFKLVFICKAEVRRDKICFLPPDPSKLSNLIKGKQVYISIDKDVLDLPLTRWGRGWLSLDELLNLLISISREKIIGVDICGEPDKLELWKIPQSERINLLILKALGVVIPDNVITSIKIA